MAQIDFPNSPSVDDTVIINGINYIWDGTKWSVYVQPESGVNLWSKDSLDIISPLTFGDAIRVRDISGNEKVLLGSDGRITAIRYNIESLSELP